MLRLDHNRAASQIAAKTGKAVADIEKLTVWGNHSPTMYADYRFATINGESVAKMINDQEWNANTFLPTVGKRGAAIIEARGLSSAASAANAAIDHMRDWALGTNGKWVTMGIPSDGQYGIPKDVMFGFPVTCENGEYKLVEGLRDRRIQPGTHQQDPGRTGRRTAPASLTCSKARPASMLDWNPALYRRYEDERTRPHQELLARVPLTEAARVVDLGCGPGNSTELLVNRFPKAQVLGTDNSEAMLVSARERLPQARFEFERHRRPGRRNPRQQPDLIYANAALQWVPDHETLIPRLFDALAPGGVLAIQMPDNRQEPTHRLMRAVAAEAPWAERIGDADKLRTELLDHRWLLRPAGAAMRRRSMSGTPIYQHRMADRRRHRRMGARHRAEALRRPLAAGPAGELPRRVRAPQSHGAYPARTDGKLLLAFPRMFIVAQKKA